MFLTRYGTLLGGGKCVNLLMYHAAETALLGMYGIVPPSLEPANYPL
jgi:hypothetical protein